MFNKPPRIVFFAVLLILTLTGCVATSAKATEPAARRTPPAVSLSAPTAGNDSNYLPVVTKPAAADSAGSLGINLAGFADWGTEYPLNDYFKSARPWITQCRDGVDPGCNNVWDTEEYDQLDLDENGWVRSLPAPEDAPVYTYVSTLLFTAEPHHGEGTYIVLYDGEGTISYDLGATKNEALSVNGRDVVDLAADGPFLLSITATDPQGTGDYIRNIRIVRPEREADYQTNLFNPDFLAKLDGFRALRFMDWMETNANTQREWASRPQTSHATFANEEGAPAELMIALANQTGKDPWFNMPHAATDDYMAQFAALVRDTLDPSLTVYVEFSNEVWNGMFPQHEYAIQQGAALFNSGDEFQDALNWHGKRAAEMCNVWKNVFAGQESRLVCVMGAHTNEWINNEILACPLWDGGPCAGYVDALAIAPYFGYYIGLPENETAVTTWTSDPDGGLDKLFTEINEGGLLSGEEVPPGGALQGAFAEMETNKALADAWQLRLLAYESGQHLVGVNEVVDNEAVTNLFIAANRDPRMGAAYSQYLDGWKTRGGELMAVFSLAGQPGKWGSWGILEYITQPGSPKYDAVYTFTTTTPCWWTGCERNP